MSGAAGERLARAIGARILAEANDLKRTPEALAAELGVAPDSVRAAIEGRAPLPAARALLAALADHYPVSPAELAVVEDDTDAGVRVFSAGASLASRRVFERPDRAGAQAPYYEYRDLAMSRTAPFRPEWIRQLRCVADTDPENADVAFNRGHLLHQLTFFAGAVNFYWEVDGKRHCAALETGDSNYITPFVPHSFTSRDPRAPGMIVAVTCAGELRRALGEFSRMGSDAADALAGDLRDPRGARRARLARLRADESLCGGELVDRLGEAGVSAERAESLVGGATPGPGELAALAAALHVRPADLMVCGLDGPEEVVVRRRGDAPRRPFPAQGPPAYFLRELARSRQQPGLKGFEVEVVGGAGGALRHALCEFVYNRGDAPVELRWGRERAVALEPGASAVVQPMVPHAFAPLGEGPGRLVLVRAPGALTASVLDEYAAFAPAGRARVAGETERWY